MLLELQGSCYHLFDPEIASRDIIDDNKKTMSTFSPMVIYQLWPLTVSLKDTNACNVYYEVTGLLPLKKE